MEEHSITLLFIIVVGFLIGVILTPRNDQAIFIAKKIVSNQGDNKQLATEEEVAALEKQYSLKIEEPVPVVDISGTIVVEDILSTGIAVGEVIIINNTLVNYSDSASLLPYEGDARVAVVDGKLYLLFVGLYSLVEMVDSKDINHNFKESIKSGKIQNIDALPLKVIGQREASKLERAYFDPPIAGKRYAIPMIFLFISLAIYLQDSKVSWMWISAYSVVLFTGFFMWFHSNLRERKALKVTRLHGQFDAIIQDNFGSSYMRFHDDTLIQGLHVICIPKELIGNISPKQETLFEVANNTLVSFRNYSLDKALCTNPLPNNKHRKWMAVTGAVLALSMLWSGNIERIKLAVTMWQAPASIDINQVEDWKTVQVGQVITVSEAYRLCELGNATPEQTIQYWAQTFCSKFYITPQPIKLDVGILDDHLVTQLNLLEEQSLLKALKTVRDGENTQLLQRIIDKWFKQLVEIEKGNKTATMVQIIHEPTLFNFGVWENLSQSIQGKVLKPKYGEALKEAALELNSSQQLSIEYGVISSVVKKTEENNTSTLEITIDLTMSKQDYQIALIQLSLAILGILIMIICWLPNIKGRKS